MHNRFLIACLSLLGAVVPHAAALAAGAPAAQAQAQAQGSTRAVLTLADAPLRLIRGATVFKAANGVALQKDDILETGAGGAQVEAGPETFVALGPQTRVLLAGLPADDRGAIEIALLQGWVKLQAGARASVASPALQLSFAGGSTIVHAGEGQDAVFAESGAQQLIRFDTPAAKGKAPLKLAAEQYVALDPARPQLAPGRPAHAFLAALPPAFRDRLARAPHLANAGKLAPVKEREADFADVAPWLQAALPVRKNFVARFRPRLADPAFRRELDHALGQSADWKPVLHPARPDHQKETT